MFIKIDAKEVKAYRSLLCSQNQIQKRAHNVIFHCNYTEHYLRTAGTLYHPVNGPFAMSSRSAKQKHCQSPNGLIQEPYDIQSF